MKENKTEEKTKMKDINEFLELNDEELSRVSGGGSTNFPCPKCGGPGYICNGHYWCDNYKTCGYHHTVEKTAEGQYRY